MCNNATADGAKRISFFFLLNNIPAVSLSQSVTRHIRIIMVNHMNRKGSHGLMLFVLSI